MGQLKNEVLDEQSKEYTLYGMILTFGHSTELNPAEYKKTEDCAVIMQYKQDMGKLLKSLLQSIRRKKGTKQGKKWCGTIKAVASCQDVPKGKKGKKLVPARLHVHVIIDGKHSRSIAKHINNYWKQHNYGRIVRFEKLDYGKKGWINGYADEQGFLTQTATI